jgi:F0F1-type ATP synthase membrane subunit b/b'
MEEKKSEQIEAIYNEYLAKLNELKKEQAKIVDNFIKEIEQKKLDKIRREL